MLCTDARPSRFSRPTVALARLLLVAALLVALPSCASRRAETLATTTEAIPIGHSVDLDRIEVWIDGSGPFLFGIDTGASGDAWITQDLADQLGLPRVGSASASDGNDDVARTVSLVRIERFSVAGVAFRNVVAPVLPTVEPDDDGPGAVGSLGFELFRDHLLTLDLHRDELRVEVGALPAPDGLNVLPYDTDRGTPFIPIQLASLRTTGHLDTGAEGGLLVPRNVADELPLATTPRRVGQMKTLFNQADVFGATLDGQARVGPIVLDEPRLGFSDLLDHVNIGRDVFEDTVLTFDQKRRRVRIVRPNAGGL